ncbi:MAG: PEGA domain-containing protein, partial [Planctomycetota bacterium]
MGHGDMMLWSVTQCVVTRALQARGKTMARSTGILLVLCQVLCLAAHSLAAETGMLYVKSFPAGATVLIEGKERGKTPVLVRGLPAGEVTVELRIAGVKPVTKQATVEANKVATIDVAIEVPSATLTIISEPLEATVILDGRDAGKTPTTLDKLQPGEHSLILLKDGHPRTARTVLLEPGSERVLEVKLGTAGGDEAARPAAGKEAAKSQAPGRVPVEVQLILTMLKETVAKGNHSETRRNLALALSQPDMANFKEELCAAIRVVQVLEMRQRHIRKGAEALVGKEVTLRTKTGPRSGRVEGVSFEGIALASKIMIEGAAAGETRGVIKWTALAPAEQSRLAESWRPEGLDGAVARAILARAGRDRAAAARAAAGAGEHPLGKYLDRASAPAVDEAAERAARSAWSIIARVRLSSPARARGLSRKLADFEKTHGKTRFAASVGEKLAALKAHATLAQRLPADAVHFGGHWYKLYQQGMTWHGAKSFCERLGGHLVTVSSRQEHALVLGLHNAAKSTHT